VGCLLLRCHVAFLVLKKDITTFHCCAIFRRDRPQRDCLLQLICSRQMSLAAIF